MSTAGERPVTGRGWVYYPARPEYAIPWLAGPLLFVVLGALGFSPTITQQFGASARGSGAAIVILVVATALNFILLLTHARAAYLSWNCAIRPTTGTLLILTVVYILLYGGWLTELGTVHPTLSAMDSRLTLHVVSMGAQVLTGVLLVSAFWKIDEPRVSDLLRAREIALPVLKGKAPLSTTDYDGLMRALEDLKSDATTGRLGANQGEILERWRVAAEAIHRTIKERDAKDVRTQLVKLEMAAHISILEKTC